MSSIEQISFSEVQQQAVIGNALQYPEVWNKLHDFGITDKWLTSASLADAYKKLHEFKATYGRMPYSLDEILESIKDDLIRGATQRALTKCVEAKKLHPWDTLEKKLSQWAKSRLIFTIGKEIAQKYNDGQHEEAEELWQRNAIELKRIDAVCGIKSDCFISSAERVLTEDISRYEDAKNIIPYSGCTFLQDSLKGILPTDVVLLGATSGSGKTEMAKMIAGEVAKEKKFPVHYLALEAEDQEIERRIKYGMMAAWYKEKHPTVPKGMISYSNWRHSLLRAELDVYKEQADRQYKIDYSTLHTYYRAQRDFGIEDFDREMYNLKGKSKLIVLDHIHFVDLDARNEVGALSELIKRVRQTAQVLKIPVICIAHLKKSGRSQGLVPEQEDFHGASNLFKTATTGIMMSKAEGMVTADSRAVGSPTFIKTVKSRLDGSLLFYTGMIFFNTFTNTYSPYYSVGKLSKNGQKWQSIKGDLPFWANASRNITDISDIE
jgi:replicative DNA helicase